MNKSIKITPKFCIHDFVPPNPQITTHLLLPPNYSIVLPPLLLLSYINIFLSDLFLEGRGRRGISEAETVGFPTKLILKSKINISVLYMLYHGFFGFRVKNYYYSQKNTFTHKYYAGIVGRVLERTPVQERCQG
jgi:hypothetical protein